MFGYNATMIEFGPVLRLNIHLDHSIDWAIGATYELVKTKLYFWTMNESGAEIAIGLDVQELHNLWLSVCHFQLVTTRSKSVLELKSGLNKAISVML